MECLAASSISDHRGETQKGCLAFSGRLQCSCSARFREGLGWGKKGEKNKTPLQFLQGRKKEKERRGEKKKLAKQGMESHPPKAQMVQLEDRSFAEDDATQGKQTVLWGVLSLL